MQPDRTGTTHDQHKGNRMIIKVYKYEWKLHTDVCGNIDYRQDPTRPPHGVKNTTLKAETRRELLDIVWKWQDENDIGAGNWKPPVVFECGKPIGTMGYNGTIIKTNRELIASKYKELTWYAPKDNAKEIL